MDLQRIGQIDLAAAQQAVRNSFKEVSIGTSGYLFAMTGSGVLTVHPAREGEDISAAQDEDGWLFIHEMKQRALVSEPGEVLYTIYPWYNELLGYSRTPSNLRSWSRR